jgi:hypothetical protein
MPWKTRLLLALLALGTVAGYGSALAHARHGHCHCNAGTHGPAEKP